MALPIYTFIIVFIFFLYIIQRHTSVRMMSLTVLPGCVSDSPGCVTGTTTAGIGLTRPTAQVTVVLSQHVLGALCLPLYSFYLDGQKNVIKLRRV